MKSILFVCMANICRSPILEATLKHLAAQKGFLDRLRVDSCGIGWFHLGEHPDPRAFAAAKARGILIDHCAQQFQDRFFEEFDLILTVDSIVSEQLKRRTGRIDYQQKIRLATDFSHAFRGQPIPDPYYLSSQGFTELIDLALDCGEGILDALFCA